MFFIFSMFSNAGLQVSTFCGALAGVEHLVASYCKAETTFTFYFSILTLSNAFLGIDNREMKSGSGFSFAIASQPFPTDRVQIDRA